ncbi:hypothetical protein [Zavarzinella formosa]|uniref:hypothetical protein n=1 Tax=Zavarzinella formosa TaxID=360055 RepID=UPI00030DF28A|nr:hypothetical protein [Zavarzinella formosa]
MNLWRRIRRQINGARYGWEENLYHPHTVRIADLDNFYSKHPFAMEEFAVLRWMRRCDTLPPDIAEFQQRHAILVAALLPGETLLYLSETKKV